MKNSEKVLKFIYTYKSITRKELASLTNLSEMGVCKILKKYLEENIIYETIEKKEGKGRPHRIVQLNNSISNILGIHLSSTKIKFYISDLGGAILEKYEFLLSSEKNIDILKELKSIILNFKSRYKISIISVAMNGIVNHKKGVSILSSNYHWKNINLKEVLEKISDIPAVVNNGSNLLAFFEKTQGIGQKYKNLVAINIGSGIGAGVIIENKLYNGSFFQVGEIGHVPYNLSPDSPICSCGKKGCLETYISDWRIEKKVLQELNISLTFEEIIERANSGGEYFKTIFLNMARALSYTIIWIDNLLDPEAIILNGKINNLGDFFKKEIFRLLKENDFNREKKIDIFLDKYDRDKIIKGAIEMGKVWVSENYKK